MSDLQNLFLIDSRVQRISIPLVFDTGATRTVISESIAERTRAIPLNHTVRVGGNGGIVADVPLFKMKCLEIGNSVVDELNVIVVPDGQLDFGTDEFGNVLKVNGFLGWDVISQFRWVIDPLQRTFKVEKPEISITKGQLTWDHMPIIQAQYQDQLLYFAFDSGNT